MTAPKLSINELFSSCRADAPRTWYLVAASALLTAGDPSQLGALYSHATSMPEPLRLEHRRAVNRRLREVLLKQWITVGVGRIAVASWSLTRAEQPGDVDPTQTKKYKALDSANRERGTAFLDAIFPPDIQARVLGGQSSDMDWLTREVVYGLFYADDGVLGFLETELLTYVALTCQPGMEVPRSYHIEGLKRLGMGLEEVEGVTKCAERVARWSGLDTSSWAPVAGVISWEQDTAPKTS